MARHARDARVTVYVHNRPKARCVGEAFAQGCGGVVSIAPNKLADGICAFYGIQPETEHLFAQAMHECRDFFYIDNGYFGTVRGSRYRKSYFRVTFNAEQCQGWAGPFGSERWCRLGLVMMPWQRRKNGYVLIACQDPYWYRRHGTTLDSWYESVIRQIPDGVMTKRRPAPHFDSSGHFVGLPLADDLIGAKAMVVHSSMAGAEAIVAGVPTVATHNCALSTIAWDDPYLVETPTLPSMTERLNWAYCLANNQWTLPEIQTGQCWRELQARGMG